MLPLLQKNCNKVYPGGPLYSVGSTQLALSRTGRVGNCIRGSCRVPSDRRDEVVLRAGVEEYTWGGDRAYAAFDPGCKMEGGPGATLYDAGLYVVAIGAGPVSTGGAQLLSRSPLILPRDGSDIGVARRRAQDRLMQETSEMVKISRMIAATTVTGMDIWRFWVYHAFAVFSAFPC